MKNELLKNAGILNSIGKFFRPSVSAEKIILKKTVKTPDMPNVVTEQEKEIVNPSMFQQIAFPAAATVGAGALVKELAYDPFMQAKAEEETLKKLKSSTPQLEDVDDKTVKDYFGVIQTFAPRAATNPLVSGALVNKMVQFEGVDSNLVKDLAQIQGDNKGGLFRKLLEGGVAASSASMSS